MSEQKQLGYRCSDCRKLKLTHALHIGNRSILERDTPIDSKEVQVMNREIERLHPRCKHSWIARDPRSFDLIALMNNDVTMKPGYGRFVAEQLIEGLDNALNGKPAKKQR